MQSKFISQIIKYDGSQLSCQYAYLQHGVLGPSAIAFRGPCDVQPEHMADGEDLLAGEKIQGADMLHFLVELFAVDLTTGVAIQRLFASLVKEELERNCSPDLRGKLRRLGDDVFIGDGKFSISVAAKTRLGVVIHFACNVTNVGTPVKTAALEDVGLRNQEQVQAFGEAVLARFKDEYSSLVVATYKVKPV